MAELIALQAAAAMAEGLVSPAHLVVDTFPAAQGHAARHRCHHAVQGTKKVLSLVAQIAGQCLKHTTTLTIQAGQLHQDLKQVMRRFGRQCRGQGNVLVKLVRQSETQLLELGQPIGKLAQSVHAVSPGGQPSA